MSSETSFSSQLLELLSLFFILFSVHFTFSVVWKRTFVMKLVLLAISVILATATAYENSDVVSARIEVSFSAASYRLSTLTFSQA